MENIFEMRHIAKNQTNTYMIKGGKMSCICLYVNPMRKILLDSGHFRRKKDKHDMFSTIRKRVK
jgi:hypothetical protein